jgi:hypothetical protein
MLDNLRDQTSFQPEEEEQPMAAEAPESPKSQKPHRSFNQATGTTAPQRLMLALMLLVTICLLGVVFLIITGKVILPLGF